MTTEQFDLAYRAFSRRRPFRPFLVEFTMLRYLAPLSASGSFIVDGSVGCEGVSGDAPFSVHQLYRPDDDLR
jgi:hypothetical protein